MKRFLNIMLLLLLPIITGLKCKKEPLLEPPEPTLPPITTEGKNTFGCLVDGRLYLPKKGSTFKSPYVKEYYYSERISSQFYGTLKIGAERWRADNEPSFQHLEFVLFKRVYSAGEYILYTDSTVYNHDLGMNQKQSYVRYIMRDSELKIDFDSYGTINPFAGKLNILRLDTINKIISGTFWFDAVDFKTGDTVEIREGRFDYQGFF
jgi:hypothetical protein